MSLHANFVLLEGDRRREVERLLGELGFAFAVVPRAMPSFNAASKALLQFQVSPTVVKQAVGLVRGWTVIYDPERAIAAEPDTLRKLARLARARLLSVVCDGLSGSCGFVAVQGAATRALLVSNGAVVHDSGPPLTEEQGLRREALAEEDVRIVLERVAFPFGAIEESGTWQVLTLEQHLEVAAQSGHGRPWWRFW
jgi:hypothetical protein